ncbi:IS110 family transposase [Rhodocytophaga rosea]|uniref:IS110 family transposase n=1 Tax=Rhodocytophaga rosea TaxID=2704465 RepID=A0A6C0GGX4_9BACT|nr:transposase [Rhodocytophaga rosea]QHT67217.1 IS110 family transposase [Rhodocytophaga rosea]
MKIGKLPSQSEKVENRLKILLAQLTYHIELLEEIVYQKFQVYNPTYLVDNLRSIPGIGAKMATVLIIVAKGFGTFTNHRQVISYIGLVPCIYQSGSSSKGKRQICKMGTSRIRSLLYMCALKASIRLAKPSVIDFMQKENQ